MGDDYGTVIVLMHFFNGVLQGGIDVDLDYTPAGEFTEGWEKDG